MKRFGIRFDRASGKRTYIIQYSVAGSQKQQSLGDVTQVTLKDARAAAMAQFAIIASGVDPVAEKKKEEAKNGALFESYIDRFLAFLAKPKPSKPTGCGKSYIYQTGVALRTKFKDLHGLRLGDILRSQISTILNEIEERDGYRSAGVARSQLSSLFIYAITEEGYDGFNPVQGTKTRNSIARERPLTPAEIKLIWKATEEPTDHNTIVRLLLLTACRAALIGSLTRAEINWDEKLLDFSAGRTKNKKRFWVPMSHQVEVLLEKVKDRRQNETGFVFSNGKLGFSAWGQALDALRDRVNELAGQDVDHWVLHDFRSTFMTRGQEECGISYQDADICLHHTAMREGTGKNYNHANYLKEKRAALQTWADYIDRIVHGERQLKAV